MARMFIVVGDGLSSGGSVVTGSPFTDIDGRPMARVGDRTLCPAHGPGTIITGDATLIVDGNAAARHGDWVSCGCQLIAGRQNLVFVDEACSISSSPRTASQRKEHRHHTFDAGPDEVPVPLTTPRSAPDCWVDDHLIDISTNGHGRYYEIQDAEGDLQEINNLVKFRISIPLRSNGEVEVLVKYKTVAAGTRPHLQTSQDDIDTIKQRMLEGVDSYLNDKFTLVVWDTRCGERRFPIRYKMEWVTSGHDYLLKIFPYQGRENVSDLEASVWKETSSWTLAHEYAHCVGIPDEYGQDQQHVETLRYYDHDGELSEPAIALPLIKPPTDQDATFMSTDLSTKLELRHAWPIAIEAQTFLTSALGRRIKCTIL